MDFIRQATDELRAARLARFDPPDPETPVPNPHPSTREAWLATNEAQLAELRTEMEQLRSAQEKARMEAIRLERDLAKLAERAKILGASVKQVGAGRVRVSDHAIVRYLQRVRGLDVEAVRREIVPEDVELSILLGTRPDGTYPVGDYELRVKSVTPEETLVCTVWRDA